MLKEKVANRLRELRKNRNLTRNQLHVQTGISYWALKKWEDATYSINSKSLEKLADFYGVSTDYILCRTDNPEINR